MTARMPSINNVIGLPVELFGHPPAHRHHVHEIVKRFYEIRWLIGLCETAEREWRESIAVQSLPQYIAQAHDDGKPGAYTVEGYGRLEIDWDGTLTLVPQETVEEEKQCQTDSL